MGRQYSAVVRVFRGDRSMIGYLGEVVFEVSQHQVKTFGDLRRQASVRLASHDLIGRKPLLEFTGPALESLSFSMTLSSFLGVDPVEEVKVLREIRDQGLAVSFVLDGTPQGEGLWLLEGLEETWRYIDNNGVPRVIECSLSLKEYIENVR